MSPDTILALIGLGITLLVTQASGIVWVVSYVQREVRGERDNADRVYARAVEVAQIQARLGSLESKIDGISDVLNVIDRRLRKLGHRGHEGEDT